MQGPKRHGAAVDSTVASGLTVEDSHVVAHVSAWVASRCSSFLPQSIDKEVGLIG